MLMKPEIEKLIPHAGAMCLLERVLEWDATRIRCSSRTHRDAGNPLRSAGALPAVCGIEYAAQAMAVHGGLSGTITGKPTTGYLASLREVTCSAELLDAPPGDLVVEAERLMGDEGRVIYRFSLKVGETQMLSGRAAVVLDVGAA